MTTDTFIQKVRQLGFDIEEADKQKNHLAIRKNREIIAIVNRIQPFLLDTNGIEFEMHGSIELYELLKTYTETPIQQREVVQPC